MPPGSRPRLAVSIGDPAGVGPDVCAACAADGASADLVLVGDRQALAGRAETLGLTLNLPPFDPAVRAPVSLVDIQAPQPACVGKPDPANAAAVLEALKAAAKLVASGEVDGLVTAPVSKEQLSAVEPDFTGHTGYLARLAAVPLPVMALVNSQLRVALATMHLPLAAVPAALDADLICRTLLIADEGMRQIIGRDDLSWKVCGLNPHAGEGGRLGTEEIDAIEPGIRQAQEKGVDASGPWPADTVFLPGSIGARDCVLAMYHDQALPVVKRADFGGTVNVTLGLPYVRTSVGHGTAYDLADTGKADASSLNAAVQLACAMVRNREGVQ